MILTSLNHDQFWYESSLDLESSLFDWILIEKESDMSSAWYSRAHRLVDSYVTVDLRVNQMMNLRAPSCIWVLGTFPVLRCIIVRMIMKAQQAPNIMYIIGLRNTLKPLSKTRVNHTYGRLCGISLGKRKAENPTLQRKLATYVWHDSNAWSSLLDRFLIESKLLCIQPGALELIVWLAVSLRLIRVSMNPAWYSKAHCSMYCS